MPSPTPPGDADDQGFRLVAASNAIGEDEMLAVTAAGRRLLVARYQGRLYAFSGRCPHAAADLSQGQLYRGRIDCPDHGYRFDISSGRALWPPDELCRLTRYEVKEVAGQVLVRLD